MVSIICNASQEEITEDPSGTTVLTSPVYPIGLCGQGTDKKKGEERGRKVFHDVVDWIEIDQRDS